MREDRAERDGERNIQTQIKKFDKLERNCREECRSHWADGGTQRVEGRAQWRANIARWSALNGAVTGTAKHSV